MGETGVYSNVQHPGFPQDRSGESHETRRAEDCKCETFCADASLKYTMTVQLYTGSVRKERRVGMLYREVKQGKIAITQPMHAWVSGQLARAWGNERFGTIEPGEEVCLGAEQHERSPYCVGTSAHAQPADRPS